MLLRVDRGRFTAEITQRLRGKIAVVVRDVDIAVMLLLLETESRIHGLRGCPFFARLNGFFKLKKGTAKQFKTCPLHSVLFPAPNRPHQYMNSHPIWGALLRMVDRHLNHSKRAPPSNAQISCKPSFPTHPQITQCLKRHTPPCHA